MKYKIYHPKNQMNHECEANKFEYTHVFTIFAATLNDAFRLSQNDFCIEYSKMGIRSTSVGDIIAYDFDGEMRYQLIGNIGFNMVDKTWVNFKPKVNETFLAIKAEEAVDHYETVQEAITALMKELKESPYLCAKRSIKGFGITQERVVDLLPQLWAEYIK